MGNFSSPTEGTQTKHAKSYSEHEDFSVPYRTSEINAWILIPGEGFLYLQVYGFCFSFLTFWLRNP